MSLAVGALSLADLPLQLQVLGVALALLVVFSGASRAAKRSPRMRLYADGGVECPISRRSALARDSKASRASALLQIDDDLMAPATLLQASSFLGLTQLHWTDAEERHHACILFPDRLDRDTRHRLRVWLATHRPSRAPFPMPRAPRTPTSATV
ncbi:MAG: hypothetical protein IPO66_12810 [Rhodanobacteraceae bacterium]|nr:hypothetical protein [Rhodanobacteraceae bacterium]